MQRVKLWQGGIALFAALGALSATAWLAERAEAVDPAASSYEWGGGRAGEPPPDSMALVPGGEYLVGDEWPEADADAPPRRVRLEAFYIDRREVTNREFARFVESTGHVTTAEREGGAWVYRGGERDWAFVAGAEWRHPLGPGSSVERAWDHPVVLVSWFDADAYARWAGKRLPTEAEWEVAARAGAPPSFDDLAAVLAASHSGHDEQRGREKPEEAPHPSAGAHGGAAPGRANPAEDGSANVWQGSWPRDNEVKDGYFYTAPAGSFAPNALGLHDMIGNVWEWTADWYAPDGYRTEGVVFNPTGAGEGTTRVARGGSWFCSPNYCGAYRPGFRGKSPPASAFNNVGFRCARDVQGGAAGR